MFPWTKQSPHPKQHFDWFSHFCTAHGRKSLYFTMGHPLSPEKLPLCKRRSRPHLIHASLSPTTKWHIDRLSHFCWAHNCDRPTDHTTPPVTISHIYIHNTAMQPNNNNNDNNNTIVIIINVVITTIIITGLIINQLYLG